MEELFKMNIVQNLITLEIILRKDNALREKKTILLNIDLWAFRYHLLIQSVKSLSDSHC